MHYADKPNPTLPEGVAIGREKGVTVGSELTVIGTYTGSAYAALRQRAQIGIDDLRQ
jgi:hypothetical protein